MARECDVGHPNDSVVPIQPVRVGCSTRRPIDTVKRFRTYTGCTLCFGGTAGGLQKKRGSAGCFVVFSNRGSINFLRCVMRLIGRVGSNLSVYNP